MSAPRANAVRRDKRAVQVARLAGQGLTAVEISVRLMLPYPTVAKLMPPAPAVNEIPGAAAAAVAGGNAGRGMARTEATAVTAGRDRHPRPSRRLAIEALLREGLRHEEIARRTGAARSTVTGYAALLREEGEAVAVPKPAARRRNCLCCGKGFRSWGPGNRLCGDCRTRTDSSIGGGW